MPLKCQNNVANMLILIGEKLTQGFVGLIHRWEKQSFELKWQNWENQQSSYFDLAGDFNHFVNVLLLAHQGAVVHRVEDSGLEFCYDNSDRALSAW